jgi:hypothetical protein
VTGADASVPDDSVVPVPAQWQEHWFEHDQVVKLVDKTDDVAIYFDAEMDQGSLAWMSPFLSQLWKYTKKTYGVPGDPRLFAILHSGRYMGGHVASVFDPSHDFRNVLDMGAPAGSWTSAAAFEPSWYLARLLQGAALGIRNDPAQELTAGFFSSIFAYDALKAVGMGTRADNWIDGLTSQISDKPRAGTHWFRDWYFPLWRDKGGAAVFARYFNLLARYYPKVPAEGGHGMTYAPAMNLGEYVHFMSGAAGSDLKILATLAFGWTDQREVEYQQARASFPAITY